MCLFSSVDCSCVSCSWLSVLWAFIDLSSWSATRPSNTPVRLLMAFSSSWSPVIKAFHNLCNLGTLQGIYHMQNHCWFVFVRWFHLIRFYNIFVCQGRQHWLPLLLCAWVFISSQSLSDCVDSGQGSRFSVIGLWDGVGENPSSISSDDADYNKSNCEFPLSLPVYVQVNTSVSVTVAIFSALVLLD